MAGGGIQGGRTHGQTDEIGFHAVEHPHYVTDVHATLLHQWAWTLIEWKCPNTNASSRTSDTSCITSLRERQPPES